MFEWGERDVFGISDRRFFNSLSNPTRPNFYVTDPLENVEDILCGRPKAARPLPNTMGRSMSIDGRPLLESNPVVCVVCL